MKTSRHIFSSASVIAYAAALLLSFSLSSCSKKASFATSTIEPAARGSVKMKKDKNNNYNVTVDVKYLAEPQRLQPAKQVYVVWAKTPDNREQNLGQLRIGHGLFSSTLKGSLDAVTPFEPIQVYITAEDKADIEYPSSYTVLAANSF